MVTPTSAMCTKARLVGRKLHLQVLAHLGKQFVREIRRNVDLIGWRKPLQQPPQQVMHSDNNASNEAKHPAGALVPPKYINERNWRARRNFIVHNLLG